MRHAVTTPRVVTPYHDINTNKTIKSSNQIANAANPNLETATQQQEVLVLLFGLED
jgi:hypothetical protein